MDLSPEWEGLVYLAGFNLGNKSDEQAGKYQNKDHFTLRCQYPHEQPWFSPYLDMDILEKSL